MFNPILNGVSIELEFTQNSWFPNSTWPQGYKTFFMLNSAEQEIYPAHKC